MEIDFSGVKQDYLAHQELLNQAIRQVLLSAEFIMGREVRELEKKLQEFLGIKHAIACSSGTSALYLSLRALDIQKGDEVITSSFSFFASSEAIALCGAKPVFVDITRDFNLDIAQVESAITARTKAILAVSLFGQPCHLPALQKIAKKHNLYLIEDGAQSFGASLIDEGKIYKSLSVADLSATSFFPAKPLGCFGDGGAVFAHHDDLAWRIQSLRSHAQIRRYEHSEIGINARLDTLQAGILLAKLEYFEQMLQKRWQKAEYYFDALKAIPEITLPCIHQGYQSTWAQFCILCERRDELKHFLDARRIPTAIHYPIALPLQKAFKDLGYKQGNFPVAEYASRHILSLPINPYLDEMQLDYITQGIKDFYAKR